MIRPKNSYKVKVKLLFVLGTVQAASQYSQDRELSVWSVSALSDVAKKLILDISR